jgi:hypothetical protein
MLEQITAQPFWIEVWIYWMIFINAASVFFVRRVEGRWVLAAGLANLVTMYALYLYFGDSRILALSHLLWWTPLVVYLFRRRAGFGEGGFGGWARLLVLTNAAALLVDAASVVRLLLGERATA